VPKVRTRLACKPSEVARLAYLEREEKKRIRVTSQQSTFEPTNVDY
jgi:hypothetical protein